ncbi:MAG: hypothetical protein KIS91_06180 [Anaerolineae bacterium]|nr:hypothetical protein [Anaerolineae bacterium]
MTRGGPIGEAVVAFNPPTLLREKLGGDSLNEMRPRFEQVQAAARVCSRRAACRGHGA